jgi:hypothetical protein
MFGDDRGDPSRLALQSGRKCRGLSNPSREIMKQISYWTDDCNQYSSVICCDIKVCASGWRYWVALSLEPYCSNISSEYSIYSHRGSKDYVYGRRHKAMHALSKPSAWVCLISYECEERCSRVSRKQLPPQFRKVNLLSLSIHDPQFNNVFNSGGVTEPVE